MTSKTLALVLLGLVVPGLCSAQTAVKAGKWTGSAVPPDQDEVALTFDVTVAGDSLGIIIHAGEHGDFTAIGGHLANKSIIFDFEPGITVHCTLNETAEGEFAGSCLGDDGSVATMKMVPPKEG
jgi:hypothetical protein